MDKMAQKRNLESNLMRAVKECRTLVVDSLRLKTSFSVTPQNFLDLTEEKYEDGIHSYRINTLIKIKKDDDDEFESNVIVHFDAHIKGTDVVIENDVIIADQAFFPLSWKLKEN